MTSPRSLLRHLAFTDTGAYFALSVVRDINHEAARLIGRRLITERWRLYTTNFVLAETHALFLAAVLPQPSSPSHASYCGGASPCCSTMRGKSPPSGAGSTCTTWT